MTNNQKNEFYCNTCKTNLKLDRLIEYEYAHKNTYVPPRIRTTRKVGIIFTKNSMLFEWHTEHGNHHDWGNVADKEAIIEAIKA